MRVVVKEDKEVPDNAVFWSIVGIISVFVVVLATVMVLKSGMSGQIVLQYNEPSRPFSAQPLACLDVPACGSDISFMCCAESPLPGTDRKCAAPLYGYGRESRQNYGYDNYGAGNAVCPEQMPYRCGCPEKFQYRQTWAVPSR
jgi:hypothetical protein